MRAPSRRQGRLPTDSDDPRRSCRRARRRRHPARGVVRGGQAVLTPTFPATRTSRSPLRASRLDRHENRAMRTVPTTARLPGRRRRAEPGVALVLAQPMESMERALDRLKLILLLSSASASHSPAWLAGALRQTVCDPYDGSPRRPSRSPHAGLTPILVSGGDDLPARHLVQLDAAGARRLPAPSAPARRRCGPRAAHAADEPAHQHRADRSGRRHRPSGHCPSTSATRSWAMSGPSLRR